MLISFAVTVNLICAFVFAQAKIRFSYDMAGIIKTDPDPQFFSKCIYCKSGSLWMRGPNQETGFYLYEPSHEKTNNFGVRTGPTQSGLCIYRIALQNY